MGGEELDGAIATLFEAFDKDGDGVSADTRPRSLTLCLSVSLSLCLSVSRSLGLSVLLSCCLHASLSFRWTSALLGL